jgi:CheY-like chemotaxis protein
MSKQYRLTNIRALLTKGFTDGQLRDFCFDTLAFRPVYNRLNENTGKEEIVRQILSHAEQIIEIEFLLDWARQNNFAQYTQHQPYYGSRILLVDDEEDWRIQLGELLRELGYEVVIASSREEAIQYFKKDEMYNLIILDMRLDNSDEENKDGVRLGEWLRNNGYHLPIIIMSAYTMDADTIKKMTLIPFQFVVVDKGRIRSGGVDDLLYQIGLALS